MHIGITETAAQLSVVDMGEGIVAGFTDRRRGNLAIHVGDDPAAVDQRRDSLRTSLGAAELCFVNQVHGDDIARAPDPAGPMDRHDADAIVTHLPGVAIGVLAADCLPILIADPTARLVMAAHAGRRGLQLGLLRTCVAHLVDAGAEVARLSVAIGPSICGKCYEVPEQMRDEVAATMPGAACTTDQGTAGLDLAQGAELQLRELGVGQISRDGRCTFQDASLYSYRRDGQTGRLAGVIMMV